MLQSTWITVITIGGGSVLAAVAYLMTWRRGKKWDVPLELWTGYLINSLTLVTLGCFIYNICSATIDAAIGQHAVAAIPIAGNEALIFWMFVYSFGQAGLSLRRAFLSTPTA